MNLIDLISAYARAEEEALEYSNSKAAKAERAKCFGHPDYVKPWTRGAVAVNPSDIGIRF